MASAGLSAHTMEAHYLAHLPYYRMESINARSGVHTPRSTRASWSGSGGGALVPVFEAHNRFVLSAAVLHADETPVAVLDPGRARPGGPMSGPMPEAPSIRCQGWFTTSVSGEGRGIRSHSSVRQRTAAASEVGAARWCATSMRPMPL